MVQMIAFVLRFTSEKEREEGKALAHRLKMSFNELILDLLKKAIKESKEVKK
uniref:Uncharacterized protein n=1 Tax=viral metagenome TaxID=1070528 RepID=A0A6H1ZC04_9ZZZZ